MYCLIKRRPRPERGEGFRAGNCCCCPLPTCFQNAQPQQDKINKTSSRTCHKGRRAAGYGKCAPPSRLLLPYPAVGSINYSSENFHILRSIQNKSGRQVAVSVSVSVSVAISVSVSVYPCCLHLLLSDFLWHAWPCCRFMPFDSC